MRKLTNTCKPKTWMYIYYYISVC